MNAPFPLQFANPEVGLLTAIVLGFFFGFSLERGGFGSPRKLAAQFYLYDMAVFKVMFTAILVAMVGLYTLVGLGLMDMSRLWINPTFVWAQLLGGFLLGVGFIMSGLCPGTSVVSAAAGRWDAVVAFLGLFVVSGFDRRFDGSRVPAWVAAAGDVLAAAGMYVISLVLRENSFAAFTIEVGKEQRVISTGPYAVVRHPMYAGSLFITAGIPLALGSWWGLLGAVPLTAGLVWRLLDEERVLLKELRGYGEYRGKVRWRLIPGVF